MATIPRVPTSNNQQYTLNAQIAASAASLTLNQSVAGIVQAPGYLVIDRINSSQTKTPTQREYKYFTGVSGANITGLSNVDGTDQVHAVGAIVEFVPDVKYEADWYTAITTEHDTTGVHVSLPSLNNLGVRQLLNYSGASITNLAVGQLLNPSGASLYQLAVNNLFNASGASIQGAIPMVPFWSFAGTLSGASAALGRPITMPFAGKIQMIDATTRIGSSNASLALDILKNGSSILAATASTSVLTIPQNGTFSSTASIATQTFVAGDVFSFSTLFGGSMAQDLTIKFFAR